MTSMATPPPEATTFPKEDKPQLPPSPNGFNIGDKGAQNAVIDVNTVEPAKPAEAIVEPFKTTGVNGHADAQSLPANGDDEPKETNGSVLKAPDNPSTDAVVQPSNSVENEAGLSNNTETAASQASQAGVQETSTSNEHTAKEGVNAGAVNGAPVKDAQTQQNAPQSPPSSDPLPGNIDPKLQEAAPTSDPTALDTNLPIHPMANVQRDAVTDHHPANNETPALITQNADQEMQDAPGPVSPTKVSREREDDLGDEPAAKRTKLAGEASRPPELTAPEFPAPAANVPAAPAPVSQHMTKMQHKFLTKSIQTLKRMQDSRFYKEPVDPIKMNIPQYFDIIKNPMDLGTIDRKLKNEMYPTAQALINDFNLMVQNAVTFNGIQHLVAQEGLRLKAMFEKQLSHLPPADAVEEKKPKKAKAPRRERAPPSGPRVNAASPQATTFALGPEGLPLIRRDSTTADGRPKRSIHPPKRDLPYSTKPKKKKYQWELRFCQETLDELHKPKYYNFAAPFYYPVDPVALNIPSYHNIIKKPMDLSTIQSKLRTGQYENAKEFEFDIRLMFKNCYKFNIVGDPTYVAGQQLEDLFDRKWAQKGRYLEAHEPQPEPQADSSDEENSDEADSDADQKVVALLQKQIAEMSRQVEAIQRKKKTPPGSKKATKTKAGKKDSTKGRVKEKKSGAKLKTEKPRWVTYQEKQLISNGIGSLPDKKMQEVLRIIQNNVPALKGTQETEIELDIDELPNEVLLMLLNFVKKNVPNIADDDEVPAPLASAVPPKPKKNKPMSKHEQEAQINMLESNLSRFQGSAHSPDPVPSVEANESSDESEDTEESEEE